MLTSKTKETISSFLNQDHTSVHISPYKLFSKYPNIGSGNLLSSNFADFSSSSVIRSKGSARFTPGADSSSRILVS